MTAPKIGLAIVETPRVIKVCCLLRLLVGAYRVEELGFHILKLSLMEGSNLTKYAFWRLYHPHHESVITL
ncbi:hypothetical protein ZEAMMB73_Zm00001d019156 [Zea mays]|uniref:Uncharacterized protein n=1 Tax=Zea mays TaxID=4577 RepID=A0A1D6HVV8_MAIZE|nr:hypothetical protein ZEAMMB73_Zm00001d019156 [Zea mays]